MNSYNPATGEQVWQGEAATEEQIAAQAKKAQDSFASWGNLPLYDRIQMLEVYGKHLNYGREDLALLISKETGKPLWESKNEVSSMLTKISISIKAYEDRCSYREEPSGDFTLVTEYRPHGVVAVFGPYNFPGHLPSGHIIPALLAGNTVLFKPSEFAPGVGEWMGHCFSESGLPPGVLQVVQGGPETGKHLAASPEIDGLFFTGSAAVGQMLQEQMIKRPGKILALEMGGNNPLVVAEIKDLKGAAQIIIQSAFLTAGQRCSCARRLILTSRCPKEALIKEVLNQIENIKIGPYTDSPEPFMGPLIHMKAAYDLIDAQEHLKELGAKILFEMKLLQNDRPFVTPALIDVTDVKHKPDKEYFGPFLQVIFSSSLEEAIDEANRTEYGLSSGLLSHSEEEWNLFKRKVRSGVINWNTPLTGASSKAPFGGIGKSGNFRPSAYLACDYCSYPVASMQNRRASP